MQRIRFLVWKEFRQVFRDKPMLAIIFVMPMIQLFLLGYAITVDVRNLDLLVCDQDRTPQSRALVERFLHTEYFKLLGYEPRPDRLAEYLDSGEANLALVVPPGYATKLERAEKAKIQLLLDGQDSNSAGIAAGYAASILQELSTEMLIERQMSGARPPASLRLITPEIRVWYNPNLESTNYMVPAVVAILLTMITTLLTAMGIVKEREVGTLEQLLVTPIKPYQLILGKTIPFAVLGFMEIIVALTVATQWFGIPIMGSFALLLAFAFVFLCTTLGAGILISTMSQTQQQALFMTWFVNIFAIIMSGFFIPIENMPRFLQVLSYLNPVRYFMTVVREIILKGAGMAELWPQGVALLIFGVATLTLAGLRFQKRVG